MERLKSWVKRYFYEMIVFVISVFIVISFWWSFFVYIPREYRRFFGDTQYEPEFIRLDWFEQCLKKIERLIPEIETIAFPYGIGRNILK